jgi:Fe-S oxidoreductase
MIPGVEWAQFSESETCCGFGGVFSAEHPATSRGMGLHKLESLNAAKPDLVVTTDMGCALHLMTLQAQDGPSLRFLHYAQLLAEVIDP